MKLRAVLFDGGSQGDSQRVEFLLSSSFLLGGDDLDQMKGEGVDRGLQIHERLPDGLLERKHREEAVPADHHSQQLLLLFDKRDEHAHHKLGVSVAERRRIRHRILIHEAINSVRDVLQVLSYLRSFVEHVKIVDIPSLRAGVGG